MWVCKVHRVTLMQCNYDATAALIMGLWVPDKSQQQQQAWAGPWARGNDLN